MKYSVDKIIGDTAVLENINTGEIINVNISKLPNGIKETDILVLENNVYELDIKEKQSRINMLREKMNKLRGGNNEHR